MLLWVLGVLLLLFSCLDVWYFVRAAVTVVRAWFQKPVWDVLGEQSVSGRVLLHDIDLGHMNNARYLRECDFARLDGSQEAEFSVSFNIFLYPSSS
ncbi:unnamed protein product [Oncorhynchus mykiss]|uniref:Protein THEM6 n=1 Tax=Oncorhynchus mykiss TaxID=8022 RepID=A0A060YMF3_ONCMY|nr:unnamed protein product [Oncorhynchus mykiss]